MVITKSISKFPGGTHPPDNKELTCEMSIQPGPAVKQVSVLLSQHIGAPCKALVQKNDPVQEGQKIGDAEAFVSAAVFSPINGKVKEIALQSHPVLGRCLAVVIAADPENIVQKTPPADFEADFDENKFSAKQICEAVGDAGIVGMGGAGFPTRVKIAPEPAKEILIVNGCECEPYITCDYRIMLEWTNKIIAGIKLARKAAGCSQVLIAIEDNKPEAIKAMSDAIAKASDNENIKVVSLKTRYPQGGERQLIQAVLGKNVPTGGIPPAIGVLVINMATAAAIAEAVVDGVPLTHRVVTVTGQAIAKPGNFYVPIGTAIGELIEFCGGLTEKGAKVIMGGPMTGTAIADLSAPTMKTTGSIIVLTEKQIGKAKIARRQTPCMRCGRCLEVCPENLNPTKIAHAVKYNDMDLADSYYLRACIECGCCSYVCPANIELTGYIKTGKIFLARQKKKVPQ